MPRLIPPERGNGKRPTDPEFKLNPPELGDATVVVLDVSDDTHELVGSVHDEAAAALEDGDESKLLTGAVVQLDNQRPSDSSTPGPVTVHVGGSTLHEAATEVIECFAQLASEMPGWVASTDDDLAKVVAEHFTVKGYSTCKQVDLAKVAA